MYMTLFNLGPYKYWPDSHLHVYVIYPTIKDYNNKNSLFKNDEYYIINLIYNGV